MFSYTLTPTYFLPHWPITRECTGCVKQLLHLIIVSSMRNCHKFINAALIKTDMCNKKYKILNYKNYKICGHCNFYNLKFYNFQCTHPSLEMIH